MTGTVTSPDAYLRRDVILTTPLADMHAEEHKALMTSGIFSKTNPDVLSVIMKQMRRVCFPPGHVVFAQGDLGDCFYVMVSGKAKVSYRHTERQEFILNIVGAPDVFGELTPFDYGTREATATTLTEVCAVTIARDQLLDWMAECPEAIHQMMRLLARRSRAMTRAMADFVLPEPSPRLARKLLLLAKRFGMRDGDEIRVVHDLRSEELSLFAGVAPEIMGATLLAFADRGWIRFEGSCLVIVDGEALTTVAAQS